MRILYSELRINDVLINFIESIEIKSTWENLTDTAIITLPRNLKIYKNGSQIYDFFKRGDKVSLILGYIQKNQIFKENEFNGYINRVKGRIPLILECENEMYQLKNIYAPNKIYYKQSVESIINDILKSKIPTLKVRTSLETILEQFEIKNSTVAQVLKDLQRIASIECYVRDLYKNDVLYSKELRCSGIHYFPQDLRDVKDNSKRERTWNYDYKRNILGNNLEKKYFDDSVRILAFSKVGKKRIEVIVPKNSTKGDIKSQQFFCNDLKTLENLALESLKRVNYEGFKGSIDSFGLPPVRHGDRINLIDEQFNDLKGVFMCKGVNVLFGSGGYRRNIELDLKIN